MSKVEIKVPQSEIIKALADLQDRVRKLEEKDAGWRKAVANEATA